MERLDVEKTPVRHDANPLLNMLLHNFYCLARKTSKKTINYDSALCNRWSVIKMTYRMIACCAIHPSWPQTACFANKRYCPAQRYAAHHRNPAAFVRNALNNGASAYIRCYVHVRNDNKQWLSLTSRRKECLQRHQIMSVPPVGRTASAVAPHYDGLTIVCNYLLRQHAEIIVVKTVSHESSAPGHRIVAADLPNSRSPICIGALLAILFPNRCFATRRCSHISGPLLLNMRASFGASPISLPCHAISFSSSCRLSHFLTWLPATWCFSRFENWQISIHKLFGALPKIKLPHVSTICCLGNISPATCQFHSAFHPARSYSLKAQLYL